MMKTYKAVVEKIILHGPHGPYAVATCEDDDLQGSITFGLTKSVWKERNHPEPGTYVVLTDIQKKRAGWRAGSGRFFQPADEPKTNKQPATQQKVRSSKHVKNRP